MALSTLLSSVNPYVTVTRTASDGEYALTRTVAGVETPVRGTLVVSGGTGSLVDREAPQGVSVTYKSGADTTIVTTNKVGSWLIHPTTSSLDRAVVVADFPEWSVDVRQDVVVPLGSKYPIVVSDVRQSRVGRGFSVLTQTAAERANLETTLESTRILLLSTKDYRAPYVWVTVGAETWTPLSRATDELWRVNLPLTEIDRPEVVSSGVVTWLDVAIRFPGADGFDDLAATYGTFDAFWADAATWTS